MGHGCVPCEVRVRFGVSGCLLAWDDGRSAMAGYVREPDGDGTGGFARSGAELAGITEWLGGAQAAGLDHGELEEQIGLRAREVARLLLQEHLDLRAEREQRRGDVTGPDGLARTRAEKGHGRLLATTAGPEIGR